MHPVQLVSVSVLDVVLRGHSHRAMDEQVGGNDLWRKEYHDLADQEYLEEKGGEQQIQYDMGEGRLVSQRKGIALTCSDKMGL